MTPHLGERENDDDVVSCTKERKNDGNNDVTRGHKKE